MSENYIKNHFEDIKNFANVIEKRVDDSYLSFDFVIEENKRTLEQAKKYNVDYILIDNNYNNELTDSSVI